MPQPPGPDLSRPRLREIASWIRDTLDPLIAREGPDVMNIDDFLTLHEIFIALQYADISATALRATRIHRAVLEVASKATRWPGRLADECDRIIMIWRARFGPLEDLRPFLYGRGGRLEGIAGVTDITRTALLKRWRDTTPELVAPHRPRIHGSLGFQAGAWWLNSLFAFRDGIIDLETTDGGICFDSNGAYAVLLNDADEVEGVSPSSFTYRCHRNDAGRFRLTAADFKSRYPVRVLRSHSLNSLWAPRAGVRYDGLHRVAGWVIRAVLPSDTNHKMDELIFEIKFEREDTGQASMEEVMRHPLANEIDDYAEYKRLRRLQREAMRMKSVSAKPALELAKVVSELSTRSSSPKASAIGLTSTIGNTSKSIGKSSPDILVHSSRQLTRPHRPTIVNRYRPVGTVTSWINPSRDSNGQISTDVFSAREFPVSNLLTDLNEVAPWMDFDFDVPRSGIERPPISSGDMGQVITVTRSSIDSPSPNRNRDSSRGEGHREKSEAMSVARHEERRGRWRKQDKRRDEEKTKHRKEGEMKESKSHTMHPLARSLNPLAKLFDGNADDIPGLGNMMNMEDSPPDTLASTWNEARQLNYSQHTYHVARHRTSSSFDTKPLSPQPLDPWAMRGKRAIHFPSEGNGLPYGFTPVRTTVRPLTDEEWQSIIQNQQIPLANDPFLTSTPLLLQPREFRRSLHNDMPFAIHGAHERMIYSSSSEESVSNMAPDGASCTASHAASQVAKADERATAMDALVTFQRCGSAGRGYGSIVFTDPFKQLGVGEQRRRNGEVEMLAPDERGDESADAGEEREVVSG